MKTLYVDLENGYKTLGNKESIGKMFGYQPLSFNDFRNRRRLPSQTKRQIEALTEALGYGY